MNSLPSRCISLLLLVPCILPAAGRKPNVVFILADDLGYYSTTAIADNAIGCLRNHAMKHPDRPFFHFIAFTAPHFPLHALPQDIAKYRDKYPGGWDAMRQTRFARQKEMGITDTTLSPLERDVGPPYAFKEVLGKIGPVEANRPVPWSELTDEQRRFQATKMAIHAAMMDRMDQEIGRAEQNDLSDKMPKKANELEQVWQKQTDEFTSMARKSLPEP